MKAVYDTLFLKKLKKANVRIRKSFKERIYLFTQNPENSQLNNHSLREKYKGYHSIDITNDWRAIYEITQIGDETVAYFIDLGTHKKLYKE